MAEKGELLKVAISPILLTTTVPIQFVCWTILYFVVFCCQTISLHVFLRFEKIIKSFSIVLCMIFILVVCKWFRCFLSSLSFYFIQFARLNNMTKMSVIKLLVSKYLSIFFIVCQFMCPKYYVSFCTLEPLPFDWNKFSFCCSK